MMGCAGQSDEIIERIRPSAMEYPEGFKFSLLELDGNLCSIETTSEYINNVIYYTFSKTCSDITKDDYWITEIYSSSMPDDLNAIDRFIVFNDYDSSQIVEFVFNDNQISLVSNMCEDETEDSDNDGLLGYICTATINTESLGTLTLIRHYGFVNELGGDFTKKIILSNSDMHTWHIEMSI